MKEALIDVTSFKVKDVIRLFEAAAQKNVDEKSNLLKREKDSTLNHEKTVLPHITSEIEPKEIKNKQILPAIDKKTFFQRLSSWPLLKPRNKVVRRATPMKTLNQLRQHLPSTDSDIDSIADSAGDADQEESDCTESSGTVDREDCESNVSRTSVTYCQKVQLKSFQHIIQEIEQTDQVSFAEYYTQTLFHLLTYLFFLWCLSKSG
ncbi:hypothetical protein WDU94_012682 [Cyamophila willieti]